MAFQFVYSLESNANNVIKDLPLDAAYGVSVAKKGELVSQTAGLLTKLGAAGGSGLGVLEGKEFTGLVASGQPYAATKTSFTDSATDTTLNPNGVGKVRVSKSSVYKVPVAQTGATQTATNAHLGGVFTLFLDGNGDQQVNLNVTTTPTVKVVDRSADGKSLHVVLLP